MEEEATLGAAVGGEEEAWAADERMHRLLKTDEQIVSDRNGILVAPAAVRALRAWVGLNLGSLTCLYI